jgi:outer membrane protein TolC
MDPTQPPEDHALPGRRAVLPRGRSRRVLFRLLGLGLAGATAGCAEWDGRMEPRLEQRVADEIGRLEPVGLDEASTAPSVTVEQSLPQTLERRSTTQPVEASRELSLADARSAVLAHNLDLQVARLDPTIARTLIDEQEGTFDPILFGEFFRGRDDRPPIDDPLVVVTQPEQQIAEWKYEPGVMIPLRTGGKLKVSSAFEKKYTESPAKIKPAQYLSALKFSISQPLLRGGGITPNVAGIRLARYDSAVVDAKTQLAVIKTLAVAEKAYWRVYGAWRELDVRKQQYDLAFDNLELVRRRVEEGLSARIEILRAEVGVTTRLETIILAETKLRLLQRELKRILNLPGVDVDSPDILDLVSEPTLVGFSLDGDALVDRALANRMELLELELKLAADWVKTDFRRNQMLPLLTIDYGFEVLDRGDSWHEAFENATDFDRAGWSVAVRAEVPLTNQERAARFRRAVLTRLRRLASRDQRTLAIRQEVLDALDILQQNWNRILAARQNVIVAGANYEAELLQFQEGLRTMTEVLETLTKLGEAQIREIRAIVDYQLAQVDVAFATGTIPGHSQVFWEPVPEVTE